MNYVKKYWMFCIAFLSLFGINGLVMAEELENKKVALLFLTRQGVNHPEFWKKMIIENADKYNVYLYADQALQDPFFENYRIKTLLPTKWDYHIKTWQLLLTEAYQNPENYKFIYLSESCLPVKSLEKIYQILTRDDASYMCYAGPWWPLGDWRDVKELPVEHRVGNHEWVILNRNHSDMIVHDREVIDIVSRYWIDSESYPSTLFSIRGCLHEFHNFPTTYVNWSMPENGGAHPYHFRQDSVFNRQLLLQAQQANQLFARKFTPTFPASVIELLMQYPDHFLLKE